MVLVVGCWWLVVLVVVVVVEVVEAVGCRGGGWVGELVCVNLVMDLGRRTEIC